MKTHYNQDKIRYGGGGGKVPKFLKYLRLYQSSYSFLMKSVYGLLFKLFAKSRGIEISLNTKMGGGIYFGHPYCITINSEVVLGSNINLNKGVTIGKEERGRRKGTPTISDNVYIGINSTVVGNIIVHEDVLIAPNTFVNCDVPPHTIVIGNPCIMKHKENATEGYVVNKAIV